MQQSRIPYRSGAADGAAVDTPVDLEEAVPYEPAIRTLAHDGNVTVKVCGELDMDSEALLRSVLEDSVSRCARRVELDLSGVTFCDCSALNLLLAARRRAERQGKLLTMRASSPAVRRLLVKTDTWPLFADTQPMEDALSEGQEDLRNEVAQLRRAMRTRPVIDQATGILMATFSLSAEDAWAVLVAVSQNTNTKLYQVAEELLTAIHGEALPPTLQTHLAAAVNELRDAAPTSG
ncbi:ANTAR domain-containing protein [Streptomyces sp. 4N124]|uniref:ANTAR domain-containing protein n=1 Tax=Streptomyces sp. 4N124 TaxID=3457420 RepID=UPI003FCF787E